MNSLESLRANIAKRKREELERAKNGGRTDDEKKFMASLDGRMLSAIRRDDLEEVKRLLDEMRI